MIFEGAFLRLLSSSVIGRESKETRKRLLQVFYGMGIGYGFRKYAIQKMLERV